DGARRRLSQADDALCPDFLHDAVLDFFHKFCARAYAGSRRVNPEHRFRQVHQRGRTHLPANLSRSASRAHGWFACGEVHDAPGRDVGESSAIRGLTRAMNLHSPESLTRFWRSHTMATLPEKIHVFLLR